MMRSLAGSTKEYNEKIKTPLVPLACSILATPLVTTVLWPMDVVKNHILAGKPMKSAFKNQYSFKGYRFAVASAAVLGADITGQYVKDDGKSWSKSSKIALTASPLLLLPVTSAFECLKLNSQINQTKWRETWNVLTKSGYKGLMRGFGAHASIYSILYASLILPGVLNDTENQENIATLILFFSSLLLTTPIDIYKTRTMLGEKVCPISVLKQPQPLISGCLSRALYFILFGAFVDVAVQKSATGINIFRIRRYLTKKHESMFNQKDDEFDAFVPEDTDDLDDDSVLAQAYIRDG